MSDQNPSQMAKPDARQPYKLPVLAVVKESYLFVAKELPSILKYAAPLILVIVVASSALSLLPENPSDIIMIPAILVIALIIGLAVSFAIAVHRHYLVGPDPRGIRTTLTWSPNHWRFFGWAILIGIVAGILSTVFSFAAGFPLLALFDQDLFSFLIVSDSYWITEITTLVFGFIIWGIVFAIIGPSLLRFPLYAINAPKALVQRASEFAETNRFRMAGIFFLGDILPFTVLEYVAAGLIESARVNNVPTTGIDPSTTTADIVYGVYLLISFLVWLAVTAVMLSIIYTRTKANVVLPETEPATPAPTV